MAAITPSRTIQTATIMKDDQQNDLDYDLKDDNEDDKDEDEDKDKDDNVLTMNQMQRMLRDMSIAVLRELRDFSLDNDNINPDDDNNAQQNNQNNNNNKG
ncbi:hypothetical protein Patl1_14772 [Pistacia atlantica]|uniref:Uncharacterized protein n=1 Tax=Pistacia atlantica TaxID=434234 RepID=A0ACC1AXS9_9ROSI|nr:hypothetical protein Patl1_14772 [Pistacia atlantica]